MKRIICCCFLLFSLHEANAQLTCGPRIGLNMSTYNRPVTLDSAEVSRAATFHIGLTIDYWLQKKMALQTGLFYAGTGQQYELKPNYVFPLTNTSDTAVSKISGTFNPSGFKIPVLFTFDSDGKPDMGKDDFTFDGVRIEAGLYTSFMIQAKNTVSTEYKILAYDSLGNTTEIKNYSEKSEEKLEIKKNNLNRFDVGATVGLGLEKSVGIGTLLVNLNFNFGLLDLYKLSDTEKPPGYKPVNHRDWSISLTYFFPSLKEDKKKTTKPAPKK